MNAGPSIVRICERWTMPLPAQAEGDVWFRDWVLRSPAGASHHLTAGWLCLNALADFYRGEEITSAVEYFGGIGAQAKMIQELWAPSSHRVFDYSAAAVEHMRSVLPEAVYVRKADSYHVPPPIADIVSLDFGDMTVYRTREGEKHRGLIDGVFAGQPRGVLITDVAASYLHLHRERYEGLLGAGTCATYAGYTEALARRLEEISGYSLLVGFRHHWSTVMAFVPRGLTGQGSISPTPDVPVGLEVV